jgi:hypothetical protein
MASELTIREAGKDAGQNTDPPLTFGRGLRKDFLFDEDYLNLNHGMILFH